MNKYVQSSLVICDNIEKNQGPAGRTEKNDDMGVDSTSEIHIPNHDQHLISSVNAFQ